MLRQFRLLLMPLLQQQWPHRKPQTLLLRLLQRAEQALLQAGAQPPLQTRQALPRQAVLLPQPRPQTGQAALQRLLEQQLVR